MKCTKTAFADEKSANHCINKIKRTSTDEVKPVSAYFCQKCLNWHITSIERKEVRLLIEKDRQVNNLKAKIDVLQAENVMFRNLLQSLYDHNMASIVGDEWIMECLSKGTANN